MTVQTRVDISAPCSHDQTLQGSQSHGGIDAFTAEDCACAAAVAEMDADESTFSQWFSQQTSGPLRHESMAGAMEAVATDTMLLIKVIWKRVEVGPLRQGLVKSGIENRHLWEPGKEILRGPDTHDVSRIVQGRQMATIFDGG